MLLPVTSDVRGRVRRLSDRLAVHVARRVVDVDDHLEVEIVQGFQVLLGIGEILLVEVDRPVPLVPPPTGNSRCRDRSARRRASPFSRYAFAMPSTSSNPSSVLCDCMKPIDHFGGSGARPVSFAYSSTICAGSAAAIRNTRLDGTPLTTPLVLSRKSKLAFLPRQVRNEQAPAIGADGKRHGDAGAVDGPVSTRPSRQ